MMTSATFVALAVCMCLGMAQNARAGMYSSADEVIVVTPESFDGVVGNTDTYRFVEYYADFCGHCKNLAPEYKKVAKALKGVVSVVAVDADTHRELGARAGVQGFPTIHFYSVGSMSAEEYNGERSAAAMAQYALSAIADAAGAALEVPKKKSKKKSKGKKKGKAAASAVVELGTDNFADILEERAALVYFYAPWCGHCKVLAPKWEEAAALVPRVTWAKVDATVHESLAREYGVSGYPTIFSFRNGKAEKYEGARSAGALAEFAEHLSPSVLTQLTSDAEYESECKDRRLCIVLFVPVIEDTGAEGRNVYLDLLKAATAKHAGQGFGWLWAGAGEQAGLEEALNVGGAGYPALAVISAAKGRYVPYIGKYDLASINSFVGRVVRGAESTYPFEAAGVERVEAWDGTGEKIESVPVDDDFDWDDL